MRMLLYSQYFINYRNFSPTYVTYFDVGVHACDDLHVAHQLRPLSAYSRVTNPHNRCQLIALLPAFAQPTPGKVVNETAWGGIKSSKRLATVVKMRKLVL
jgi:hypothetical protein